LGTLIYIQNMSEKDIYSLLKNNIDYDIINANNLTKQRASFLEMQVNIYKHLKDLFQLNRKNRQTTVIVHNVYSNTNFHKEFKWLIDCLPINSRPDLMIIFTEQHNKCHYANIFKNFSIDYFTVINSETKLLKLLNRKNIAIRRSVLSKRIKKQTFIVFIIFSIIFFMYVFRAPIYLSLCREKPLKNEKVEIVRQIMFQNNSDQSSDIQIHINSDTSPKILNYNSSLNSTKYININPGKNNEYALTVKPYSRKSFYISYTYDIHSVINKKNINIGSINFKPIDDAKSLVLTNDAIKLKAGQIASSNLNDNEKFLRIYKHTIKHMNYTFDFAYAHKGSITAFLTGMGVCEEYASLFTALAQSVNLPCKYNNGIVVETNKIRGAYASIRDYHAWPEIYCDNIGWVPVEVTYSDPIIKKLIDNDTFASKLFQQNSMLYLELNNESINITSPSSVNITNIWLIRRIN